MEMENYIRLCEIQFQFTAFQQWFTLDVSFYKLFDPISLKFTNYLKISFFDSKKLYRILKLLEERRISNNTMQSIW